MRAILILFVVLSLPACAGKQAIAMIPPAACAKMVPQAWAQGVEATPVPMNADATEWMGKPLTVSVIVALIAPWASGYLGMSGQLEKANGRTADAMTIQATCEAMVNAARPENR